MTCARPEEVAEKSIRQPLEERLDTELLLGSLLEF